MTYSLRIIDLPSTERPRERLLAHGVKHLKNAELLAILLGTGQGAGKLSAIGLGEYILNHLGQHQRDPLERLRDVHPQELMAIPGVGPAKATAILAAIELGQRACALRPPDRTVIDSPDTAVAALSQELMWATQERFAILLLDVKNRLLGTQLITIGTATETLAPPRKFLPPSSNKARPKRSSPTTIPPAAPNPAKPISNSPVNYSAVLSCWAFPCWIT